VLPHRRSPLFPYTTLFRSEDVTCYFETVPKARYQTALELESDRMRNALISIEETEAERTVIVSEREGYENDPSFLLGEELQAIRSEEHTSELQSRFDLVCR